MFRNPNEKNSGKFILLSDFLNLAKTSTSLSGVLISVEVIILKIFNNQIVAKPLYLFSFRVLQKVRTGSENLEAINIF